MLILYILLMETVADIVERWHVRVSGLCRRVGMSAECEQEMFLSVLERSAVGELQRMESDGVLWGWWCRVVWRWRWGTHTRYARREYGWRRRRVCLEDVGDACTE